MVKAQLDHQALHSQELLDPLRGYLAKAMADITPGELQYCFFTNGGAEAVEMALKLARIATGGRWYISTVGAFHGKSMGAVSMGGKGTYRTPSRYGPALASSSFSNSFFFFFVCKYFRIFRISTLWRMHSSTRDSLRYSIFTGR